MFYEDSAENIDPEEYDQVMEVDEDSIKQPAESSSYLTFQKGRPDKIKEVTSAPSDEMSPQIDSPF